MVQANRSVSEREMPESDQIRLIVDRLTAVAAAQPETLPAHRWRHLLLAELRDLKDLLGSHFAHEEEGGYLIDVLRSRPELRAHVEMLEKQHPVIAADVDDIVDMLGGGVDIALVERRIRHLLATLGAHEHAELELVREVMLRDVEITD